MGSRSASCPPWARLSGVNSDGRLRESSEDRIRFGGSIADYAVAVAIFTAACLACWMMGLSSDGDWLPVMYAGSGGAALFLWWRVRWPDSPAQYLSFGGVCLLSWVAFHILAYFDHVTAGEQFGAWPFPVADPVGAVFKGEIMTFLGTIGSIAVWQRLGGLNGTSRALFDRFSRDDARFFLFAYVISLVMVAASLVARESVASLGLFVPTLVALGSASVLVLPGAWAKAPPQRLLLSVLLTSPFLLTSLGSGMKSEILIAVLPVALNAWTNLRSTGARVLLVATALTSAAVVTSYVGYFREQVWNQQRDVSSSEVLDEFIEDLEAAPGEALVKGLERFAARSNLTFARAWAVSLADEDQYDPELVLAPLLYLFIPRAIWPEKPANMQGQDYTILLFGSDTSSTAVGLFTGFYLAAGWLCVAVGTFFVGATVAASQAVARRLGGGLLESMLVLVLVPSQLNLTESWPVGPLTRPLFVLVYLYAAFLLLGALSHTPKLSTTRFD